MREKINTSDERVGHEGDGTTLIEGTFPIEEGV